MQLRSFGRKTPSRLLVNQAGFTLLELLTVIIVVFILAAIVIWH